MLTKATLKPLLIPAAAVCAVYLVSMLLIFQFSIREAIPGSLEVGGYTPANYLALGQKLYASVFLNTLMMCTVTALVTLLIGYPLAYYIVRAQSRLMRSLLFFICLMPLFLGDVPRSYAWILMLGSNGALNSFLLAIGIIERPIQMLFTTLGVIIALVHITLPFMVVLLAVGISHIDRDFEKAATSLGARPYNVFLTITLPLSAPAILAGTMTVFALNFSAFATPIMIGGGKVNMISNLVYQLGIASFNFPFAAAMSLAALALILVIVGILGRVGARLAARVGA
jgi:putative spermidine/putrescine transport system permease protein